MRTTNIVALFLTLSAANAIRITAQGQMTNVNSNLINPANLPLETKGSKIVDKNGDEVRLACVNWYGAHMEQYVVNGLDLLNIDDIAQNIANDGFNCIRLPFSLDQYFVDPVVKDSVVKANPSLKGKKSMEVFDITVKALVKAGLMVILNNHNSEAMWCCSLTDGDGLWHTSKYGAEKWEEVLLSLTKQYKDEPMVIGNDLRNEIRNNLNKPWQIPAWGNGDKTTDWKMAAEKVGNAILKIDPTQLIIIEGLNFATDMSGIRNDPIKLDVANRVVYSYHYYSWEPYVAEFKGSYEQFRNEMDYNVAFMLEEGHDYTAPVWLGEFGTNSNSSNYWSYLIRYLDERPQIGWAYWAYNGYTNDATDEESFGLLNKDMKTVRHDWKLADLKTIQKGRKLEQNLLRNVAVDVVKQFDLVSQYTAKERDWWSSTGNLNKQIKTNEAQLKSDGSGLSQSVLDDIVNMGWDAAWHAANKRALYADYLSDLNRFNQRAASVANSGYFTQEEANHLKWCAWNEAWYYTNEVSGNDSASDLEGVIKHCNALSDIR